MKGWRRWAFRLLFFGAFGFTGGVLYLLFFLVPFEQRLADWGMRQETVDIVLGALVVAWGLLSLLATAAYSWLFLNRPSDRAAAVGVLGAAVIAGAATFYFLLDTDFMIAVGSLSEESVKSERFTFGAYPDEARLEELEDEGYDGVITLLNPEIPFEGVLLREEKENGEKVGMTIHSYPMLPWISDNEVSLQEIKRLVADDEKRYYIHCYLGKHRVDYVRQALGLAAGEPGAGESEPLPESLERGRLVPLDDERVILGPYPTEEEWFNIILRRNVREIVSTLDPSNPQEARIIEEERRIAEKNGLTFTLMPLNAESPDPDAAREVAEYVAGRDAKVYVHDFLDSQRFEALEPGLRDRTR